VPHEIDDEDFWTLLQISGKYRGLSPWQPGKYGHYEIVSVRPRRQNLGVEPDNQELDGTTQRGQ
jgi:hypothetical protein